MEKLAGCRLAASEWDAAAAVVTAKGFWRAGAGDGATAGTAEGPRRGINVGFGICVCLGGVLTRRCQLHALCRYRRPLCVFRGFGSL